MAKKGLVIAAVAAVMGAGAAGGMFYWQTRDGATRETLKQGIAAAAPKVAYVEVKEMTLRLADTSTEHYIKLTPVLAVQVNHVDEISTHDPVIRDRLVTLVSAHSSAELSTPQGETQLKHDILAALRSDFGDEVIAVYFTGYLVE
ncbi:MAG: flagellar basal body-associated FliL family protein [Deltaproteobacteria bacterium]|nr:flagellar basal body-associated FliL family protein [Deltaproteobacteria bacterium]